MPMMARWSGRAGIAASGTSRDVPCAAAAWEAEAVTTAQAARAADAARRTDRRVGCCGAGSKRISFEQWRLNSGGQSARVNGRRPPERGPGSRAGRGPAKCQNLPNWPKCDKTFLRRSDPTVGAPLNARQGPEFFLNVALDTFDPMTIWFWQVVLAKRFFY